jgi:hypothetical protein
MRGAWRAKNREGPRQRAEPSTSRCSRHRLSKALEKYDGARSGEFEGEERNELVTLIDLGYALVRAGAV